MTTEPDDSAKESKTKVFVSYAREDLTFVERLEAALKARGIAPLIDKTEIYAFDEWWKRIETVIGQADTFVFVISPDSVTSEVCRKEAAFAHSLNKRLAPIVWRRVDDKDVPEALASINYVFFDGETEFDASVEKLAEALTTDIAWVRKHTEFGEAARRWAAAGHPGPRGLLLRSPVLEEAEQWIAARPADAPPPTADMQAFIAESRRAATRRRNALTVSLGVGFLFAVLLSGLAFWQRGLAIEQRRIAEEQRQAANEQRAVAEQNEGLAKQQRDKALRTQSRFLADLANQRTRAGDSTAGMLMAIDALPGADGVERPYEPSAEAALFTAFGRFREIDVLSGHSSYVLTAAFSPDGKRVVTGAGDNDARIWEVATGLPVAELKGHRAAVRTAVFSSDGRQVLTASWDKTARTWDIDSGKTVTILDHSDDVQSASFSPDNRRVVTTWGTSARIWDAQSGKPIVDFNGHSNFVVSASFSPDGRRVVTGSFDNTARVWEADTGQAITVLTGPPGLRLERDLQPRWPASRYRILGHDGAGVGCRDRQNARPFQRPSRSRV